MASSGTARFFKGKNMGRIYDSVDIPGVIAGGMQYTIEFSGGNTGFSRTFALEVI